MNGRGQRRSLPEGLRPGERDFFLELRRVVDVAGLTTRELEKRTLTVRTGTAAPAFYSKSQWSRWLNGQGVPPRQAVQRLAAVLEADDIDAGRLLALHQRTAVPAQRVSAGRDERDHEQQEHHRQGDDGRTPPRQVPTVTPDFTGRAAELAELDDLVNQAGKGAGAGVVVIAGTAGVGKTTLAAYFGQRIADRFPGGQLYVNLRGFDPGGQPADPAAALRGFLEALGETAEPAADDVAALAARYRTRVAGRRLLIVLDNARDEEQARPLIPGSPGCLVVVTSRNDLAGLLAQGARGLTLAPFSEDDAQGFLIRRLGAGRVEREPWAAAELIGRCAGLPLAMSVAAAHAAAHPGFPLAALARELRSRRLDQLETGDRETSARAVFSWSYDGLPDDGRRMFRLLGIHPGPDTSVEAAASLAALTAGQAHAALRGLARAHLVEEHVPGRFAMHDLLRAYAGERAAAVDGRDALEAAELRLLDHYLHTGYAAALLIVPATDFGDLGPPCAGVVIQPPGTAEAAVAWYAAESRALFAACARAAGRGLAAHSWQLPWALAPYLFGQGRWADSAATLRAALAVAEEAGDLRGQGHVHYHLAHALDVGGESEAAAAHLRQSLEAFTATADRPGQGLALYGCARVLQGQGRLEEALPVAQEALRLRAEHGTPAAVATTETFLGSICARLGRYAEAIDHCQRALRVCEEAGFGLYRAEALDYLGLAYSGTGDDAAAAGCHERAAEAYREVGALPDLAIALSLLAAAQEAAGDTAGAQRNHAAAEAIIDGMPPGEAARLREWIEQESAPPPPAGPPQPDPGPPTDP
jgi:tetratricopeptide (TPR) repeat protein